MADIIEIRNYLNKLKKTLNRAEFNFLGHSISRKKRIDDLFCCLIALFPESYIKALKNRSLRIDQFQSVAAFNRLSKIVKRPALLLQNCYMYRLPDVNELFELIDRDIAIDIQGLEKSAQIH